MRIAVPDLISNSYFPAVAAVELGCLRDEGIDATVELLFPVSTTPTGRCAAGRSTSSPAPRTRRWPPFRSGTA